MKRWSIFFLPALLAAQSAPVTYSKHIAPIIYQNCSECHRPGEAAPFSLLSYQDAMKKGKIIAAATKSKVMPPWKADQGSFAFRDTRGLKDAEINLIQEWVKQGMPEGNPKEAPAPPTFGSGWRLGEPDLVVEMPTAFHIPADGPDIYRNIPIPLGTTEDKWLAAVDMKLTANSVVHHVLYFADPTGKIHTRPSDGPEPGFKGMGAAQSIGMGGWALGAQPHFLPNGLARELPKGSDFIVQYHFHPDGKPREEKSKIAFYFAKQAPEKRLLGIQLPPNFGLFSGITIPPGEKDYVIRDSYTLPAAIDVIGVTAHAHNAGRKMKMTATLPNGEVKTLLSISDWDFAWQDQYYFADSHTLPAGTRLDGEVHWDNSPDNARNAFNPPILLEWGEASNEEMGSVILTAVPHDMADMKTLRDDYGKHSNQIRNDLMKNNPDYLRRVVQRRSVQ